MKGLWLGLLVALVLGGCRLQVPFIDLEMGHRDNHLSEREIKNMIERAVDERSIHMCRMIKESPGCEAYLPLWCGGGVQP